MKKSNLLFIIPALFCGAATSCGAGELIGTSSDLSNVYSTAEKVASSKNGTVKNIEYYSVKETKERFEVPSDLQAANPDVDIYNIGFRLKREERLTRIDLNPNDYFYYDFNTVEYTYYKGYTQDGSVSVEKLTLYEGWQFYKDAKANKYVVQYYGRERINDATEFFLEDYPAIQASAELLAVESNLDKNKGKLSLDDGKIAFEQFFLKVAELDFKIDSHTINDFESDKTGGYEYYATDTTFSIKANKELPVSYNSAIGTEGEDGKVTYEPYSVSTVDPFIRRGEVQYELGKTTWLDTEVKTVNALRRVDMNYNNSGWLTNAVVSDERTNYNYVLDDGVDSIISSYYLTADFNHNMPHTVGVKK